MMMIPTYQATSRCHPRGDQTRGLKRDFGVLVAEDFARKTSDWREMLQAEFSTRDDSVAVDLLLMLRAARFIGVPYSTLSSNVVRVRLAMLGSQAARVNFLPTF